ncbi:MAG: proton-conducting transporter membrane subunit [Alphaproteobacteria bacterium]
MVAGLLHPLNIFIIGLGGGFLVPLVYRLGQAWLAAVFVAALACMTLISGVCLFNLARGAAPVEILTAGGVPPFSINLRVGLTESVFAFAVNLIALLGAAYFVRAKYAAILLYLILVMGIQGMVMTRDLFNLFVFLEIVSIATYGLLALRDTPAALSATFKYLMATVLASTFFLLGTGLLYSATGMLNIDDIIAMKDTIAGPIGPAALMFLLGCLLIELKPFPANGWGLDVYETAQSGVAALIAVGVTAGVFFALVKLLPLFGEHLAVVAALGAVTFVASNLIGLRQDNAPRLLGYSSIGQMGLLTMTLALLRQDDMAAQLIIAGLFINHLLAKAGLFWLAGHVGADRLRDWSTVLGRPIVVLTFGILLAAIAGFPPFPGFWAKWHLVFELAASERYIWIAIVLLGSLLEAAYLFGWLGRLLRDADEAAQATRNRNDADLLPVFGAAFFLVVTGLAGAIIAGLSAFWVFVPLFTGFAIFLLDGLPGRTKALLVIAATLLGGLWLVHDQSGVRYLFAVLLYSGGAVLSVACLYRSDQRPGFHALLAVLLLSLPALPRASTSLEFFFIWETITLSSYFLVVRRRESAADAFPYLLFSLVAAFFLLVGFAMAHAVTGTSSLTALRISGPGSSAIFVFLAIGFLIKAGAIGVHVWLPGVYTHADDDLSAILSALVSKVAMFGLLIGTYVAVRSEMTLPLAYVLGWIGALTTLAGAMMAVRQDDVKRMLAYSSMSQLGYIVTAIALLSHLGWVTALYLVANHMMVKGILFLTIAAVILRVGRGMFVDLRGIAWSMPYTFGAAAVAIVSMSGLPPLAGFGAKWLLLSALMEKGWYGQLAVGVLATFVGFLYMARFILTAFLPRPAVRQRGMDAPAPILVTQYLMIAGILVVSFYPKLLINQVSAAIDPYFASTLVWEGMSLELIYGHWNPVPVMALAVIASVILWTVLSMLQRTGRFDWLTGRTEGGARASASDLVFYPLFAVLTPPMVHAFWSSVSTVTLGIAERTRRVYTGNGQVYCLYILYYFVFLYLVCGGFNRFWTSS